MEDFKDVTTNKRKTFSKKQKVLVAVVASALVLVAAGAGIAVAVNNTPSTEDTQTKEQNTVVTEKGSTVSLTVKGEGLETSVTQAKVRILNGDGQVVVEEFEVRGAETKTFVGKLKKGDYTLEVTTLPVLADGSTYKAPEKPYEFTVRVTEKQSRLTSRLSGFLPKK